MKKVPGPPCSDQLCVRGGALLPLRPPVSEKVRWGARNVVLFPQDPEDSSTAFSVASTVRNRPGTVKKALPLNVANCRSAGVRSGLLRQIHETVEVEDFRRLLVKLIKVRVNKETEKRSDALLSRSYIDALHRELDQHMEVLRTLAETEEDAIKTTTNA